MPWDDMEIIYATLPGGGIIAGFGKIVMLKAWAHVRFYEGMGVKSPTLLDSVILLYGLCTAEVE